MPQSIANLVDAYVTELVDAHKMDADYPAYDAATAQQVANRMIKAIREATYPADWYNNNPALRRAGRKMGLAKSADLRAFIKQQGE